jgi:hypothetical protein
VISVLRSFSAPLIPVCFVKPLKIYVFFFLFARFYVFFTVFGQVLFVRDVEACDFWGMSLLFVSFWGISGVNLGILRKFGETEKIW